MGKLSQSAQLAEQLKKKAESIKWAELAKAMAKKQAKDAMSKDDLADVIRYLGMNDTSGKVTMTTKPEPTIDDLVAQEVRKLR